MNIGFNSISSALMYDLTRLRNRSDTGKKIAVVGYPCITAAALVESAAAALACAASTAVYPVTSTPLNFSARWLSSSYFTIYWSAVDFFLNFGVVNLIADEESARRAVGTGNIMRLPRGSIT